MLRIEPSTRISSRCYETKRKQNGYLERICSPMQLKSTAVIHRTKIDNTVEADEIGRVTNLQKMHALTTKP